MGIRSLLRNAFGRSKATREETGAVSSGADTPESATIPEAREESNPASATAAPEAEVPAARTAPTEVPAPEPTPTTASLPAQGSPVDDRTEAPAREESAVRSASDAESARPSDAEAAKSDEPTEAAPETTEAKATEAPEESSAAAATPATDSPDTISDLVSQAFDKPAASPAPAAGSAEEPAQTAKPAETATGTAADEPAKAEPKPEPKPAAKAEPEAQAAAKPKAATKRKPAAKAEPEVGPEPAAASTDTATAPAATPAAGAPAAAKAAEASPALSLSKVEATAPGLVSLYKSASTTLEKHGLATQRAAVYLVLDRSGSMRNYYKDGTVQNLAEQALGLSANLDDDGTVPVVFFSTDIDGSAELDLANYEGRIEELHAGLGHMGRTNYHWAINAVVEHYKKSGSTAPAFVIFQTDGAPTSKPAAEKALCDAAGLPIFWQFIGFGDPDAKGFDFLRKLDDLAVPDKRVVDNAGFFHAGRDPRSLSADELYQQLMVEFPEWLTEARAAGVVKDN
ncbi:VWA domain-containing protein [Streptomyces sp. NPDC048248]|uniref:VWA domain-containing protein n=1 Tax=Streptomyces sp. NPDC048248 TaxID=3365523 RepID=UPI00371A8F26